MPRSERSTLGSKAQRRGDERRLSEQSYEEIRTLCRGIATALALGNVVLFHTDADSNWTAYDGRVTREFDEKIRRLTKYWLSDLETREGRAEGWADACIQRLIHVVPTWSIEAWTYQATGKARELCRAEYSGRDVAKFDAWESDRAALDEVEKPKDKICLRNRHNAELASAVPAADVVAVGKSFAHFVGSLRALSELAARMQV